MAQSPKPNFWRDNNGNLSIISGVVGLLLMTAVGAALDGGQMFSTKQRLQSITDAAALTATMRDGISSASREKLAVNSIYSHAEKVGGLNISSTTIDVNEAAGQVYVALTADVPLLFGGVLGKNIRSVSASSLAEGSSSMSMNSLSISLVLDLSPSMGDRFDNGSKLASVNSAMTDMLNSISSQFGSEVAAATQISTGVYPFNWGMVDGETVTLEPGTSNVLDSMSYLSLARGSVPTTAMEHAVQDQLDEMLLEKDRDRYIVYVTDGKVDEDKSDEVGRYLRASDMFTERSDLGCQKLAQELAILDVFFGPDLVETSGGASALGAILPEITFPKTDIGKAQEKLLKNIEKLQKKRLKAGGALITVDLSEILDPEMQEKLKDDKHAGHDHSKKDAKDMAERIELREEFMLLCEPIQPIRVANACEKARDSGISVIAINLSGQDQIASNTTDMCVNGFGAELDVKKKTDEDENRTRTLPSGIQVRVSADGKSYAGDATSLDEIKDMLATMLPKGASERRVRLVR